MQRRTELRPEVSPCKAGYLTSVLRATSPHPGSQMAISCTWSRNAYLWFSNSVRNWDHQTGEGPAELWEAFTSLCGHRGSCSQGGLLSMQAPSLPHPHTWHFTWLRGKTWKDPRRLSLRTSTRAAKLCFLKDLCGPPQICIYPFDFQRKLFRVY